MLQTVVWAGVVLVLGGGVMWLVRSHLQRYVAPYTLQTEADEVALRERRVAVEIAEGTVEATIALQNAELARKTAEAEQATLLVGELRGDQLKAERAIIAARLAAEQRLATDYVQMQHEAARGREEDIVGRYARYVAGMGGRTPLMGLGEFILRVKGL